MSAVIRPARAADRDAIWAILEPVIRAGETYPLPRDWDKKTALDYWFALTHLVYVAEDQGQIVGTYYLKPNNLGGGAHIANCGYMVRPEARGRGIARALCIHSLDEAKAQGYQGMQFNFVIASNEAAVHLWTQMGFKTLGRLPDVFDHPRFGPTDALVMFRPL